MAPQRLEKIESAPGNGRVSDASNTQDVVLGRAADRVRPRLRAASMTKLQGGNFPGRKALKIHKTDLTQPYPAFEISITQWT
jgi:hypothetical protein